MKLFKIITTGLLATAFLAAPLTGFAADKSAKSDKKSEKTDKSASKYPLTTCVVSGEKLGGDMGDPYVFKQDGKEVQLCYKSCLKDFKKDPAKYMKKIEEAKMK